VTEQDQVFDDNQPITDEDVSNCIATDECATDKAE